MATLQRGSTDYHRSVGYQETEHHAFHSPFHACTKSGPKNRNDGRMETGCETGVTSVEAAWIEKKKIEIYGSIIEWKFNFGT